jgi:hypothetical protein
VLRGVEEDEEEEVDKAEEEVEELDGVGFNEERYRSAMRLGSFCILLF